MRCVVDIVKSFQRAVIRIISALTSYEIPYQRDNRVDLPLLRRRHQRIDQLVLL